MEVTLHRPRATAEARYPRQRKQLAQFLRLRTRQSGGGHHQSVRKVTVDGAMAEPSRSPNRQSVAAAAGATIDDTLEDVVAQGGTHL